MAGPSDVRLEPLCQGGCRDSVPWLDGYNQRCGVDRDLPDILNVDCKKQVDQVAVIGGLWWNGCRHAERS